MSVSRFYVIRFLGSMGPSPVLSRKLWEFFQNSELINSLASNGAGVRYWFDAVVGLPLFIMIAVDQTATHELGGWPALRAAAGSSGLYN